jgi:hypothetical protein
VATHVNKKTLRDHDISATMKGIDIAFIGDHGQGKFNSVLKITIRGDGKKVTSMVLKVGHIDCKKDTYEVIKRSIARPLDDLLAKSDCKWAVAHL